MHEAGRAETTEHSYRRKNPAAFGGRGRPVSADPRSACGIRPDQGDQGTSGRTTSIFPDSARGTYVLPVTRAVRAAEGLVAGDVATVTAELIDF